MIEAHCSEGLRKFWPLQAMQRAMAMQYTRASSDPGHGGDIFESIKNVATTARIELASFKPAAKHNSQ